MTLLHDPDLTVAPPGSPASTPEWWVGNARTFAGFLCSAFGFEPVAYSGPGDPGRSDRVSYLLRQGSMRFMVMARPPGLAHRRARPGVTATASATSPSGWTTSTRRPRTSQRGGTGLRPPDDDTGRARHHPPRCDRDLRRHRAHPPRPQPLRRAVRTALRAGDLPAPVGPGESSPTMWSATSSWAPSSAGCTSTSRSSASASSCTSTTTRSRPSTRR